MFHAAGLAGSGSSSYIDAVILRDKDADELWTDESDATLEERRYYCQNWRADVVALLTAGGDVSEWIRYSAYGEATVYPFINGDYDGSGGVDGDDVIAFLADQDNNIAAADVDRNGYVDGDDTIAFYASWDNGWMSTAWTAGGGLPANAGQLSVTSGNRIGYAGYQFDPATEQYHVRHRVYSPEMGRWTRRDPLGYVDGESLAAYVRARPLPDRDPSGLVAGVPQPCNACPTSPEPGSPQPKPAWPGVGPCESDVEWEPATRVKPGKFKRKERRCATLCAAERRRKTEKGKPLPDPFGVTPVDSDLDGDNTPGLCCVCVLHVLGEGDYQRLVDLGGVARRHEALWPILKCVAEHEEVHLGQDIAMERNAAECDAYRRHLSCLESADCRVAPLLDLPVVPAWRKFRPDKKYRHVESAADLCNVIKEMEILRVQKRIDATCGKL